MPMPDLIIRDLAKSYRSGEETLAILTGVNLQLARGEAVAITGPSGSGKSTLLYILGGLDRPTSGSVELAGQKPLEMTPEALAGFRNSQVGFVFQDHHLLPQCTVLENVLIPALPGRGADAAAEKRATELLTRVGLADRLAHHPAELSGGERQRVAVCRALINQPVLVLADEPTGNLDRATADAVGSLLLELNRAANTLLICVTHSPELAARFPRHLQLRDGQLVE